MYLGEAFLFYHWLSRFYSLKTCKGSANRISIFFFLLINLKTRKTNSRKKLENHHENIQLIEGDITKENLGLSYTEIEHLANHITHCVHLAALYDLTIPYDPAYSCNVIGTKNVLSFVEKCKDLKRFCYYSTAYVSGNEQGKSLKMILESLKAFVIFTNKQSMKQKVLLEHLWIGYQPPSLGQELL